MRLLWLNANLLLPLDKGGRLRTWHLMRHLASRHDITYLCFAQPEDVERYGEDMSAVCAHLETVPGPMPPRTACASTAVWLATCWTRRVRGCRL